VRGTALGFPMFVLYVVTIGRVSMTATDVALIALGERFEKLLLEHMDAWLEWAPRMRAAHAEVRDNMHSARAAPPIVAPRTRIASAAGIRLDQRKSVRPFKGIFCHDISEFESYMPIHAVGSQWRVYPVYGLCEQRRSL
jgi:hypothetical protein